ncbi:MAG: hypothetical protein Q7S88_03010 [Candidatus Daviesbacteria bacterium]|nr:hypothetical protein [Candidatus Daviesbacteria bacterium]
MAYSERYKTLIVANTAEAFSGPISCIANTKQREDRIRIENILSQRAIFWEEDNKVVITPQSIPQGLFEYNRRVLGLKNTLNISPEYQSHSLSQNILNDKVLLRNLSDLIRSNPGIRVTAYAYTRELRDLINYLRKQELEFITTEEPQSNLDLVLYLDSKSGFRSVLTNLEGVMLPEGSICQDEESTIKKAEKFLRDGKSCVIKANTGESGWGLLILKKDDPLVEKDVKGLARSEFRNDGIWNSRPFVVEEYIDIDTAIGGGSPSTELFISDTNIKFGYHCGQLFGKEGEFSGIIMGKDVLDKYITKEMTKMSLLIAKKYQQLGYRGFFDIDFAVSRSGLIYVLETNTRRTGGTHIFDLAKRILQDKWKDYTILSNDSFRYGKEKSQPEFILRHMEPFLYSLDKREGGVVVTLVDNIEPIMGYAILARSQSEAETIQNALFDSFPLK